MIEIKHECPECSKINILGYGFKDLEKCLGVTHQEAVCPDCKHVGMNLRFEIDGFGKKTFFVPTDSKVLSIDFPESFFQQDFEGQLIGSITTERENAESGIITFIAVGKRTEGRVKGRVLRTHGSLLVRELPFTDAQIERLSKLRPLEYVHKVISIEPDKQPLDSADVASKDSKQQESGLPAKNFVFIVTAKNSFTRTPMFIAEDGKGTLGVTDAIRDARVYESAGAAEKVLTRAQEEFGKAYTSYSIEPLPRSLVSSIVLRGRNRRR